MNRMLAGLLFMGTIQAAGCDMDQAHEREINTALVCSFNDTAINNAILVQHTLFPYHFVPVVPLLNELVLYDFKILAEHYRDYPGPLVVQQGEASPALYEARLAYVRKALTEAGVAADRIAICDGPPGGDGMAADRVLTVLEREKKGAKEGAANIITDTPTGPTTGPANGATTP